jgi:hypothetical protein
MRSLIIDNSDSTEDKLGVIMSLAEKILKKWKARQAFDRLFGTHLPHHKMERLFHLNSRALTRDFNERVFRLLAQDPNDFYEEEGYVENHSLQNIGQWKDGSLLTWWQKSARDKNPHHIIAWSRGGRSSRYNFWQFDRKTHDDFHTVFQNLTPSEQVKLLLFIFENDFAPRFKAEVTEIIEVEFPDATGYSPKAVNIERYF